MTTTTQTLAESQSRASRSASESIDNCYICRKSLFISFFFDALGHDRAQDLPSRRASNVAKVLSAHQDTSVREGIYRYYYEGLGTDLRTSGNMREAAVQALKETGKAVVSNVGGNTSDAAQDSGKDALGRVANGQSVQTSARQMAQGLPGQVKDGLLSPGNYVDGALSMAMTQVVDMAPQWRDSMLAAATLNTGAKARLAKALADFDQTLASQTLVVTVVQVAVFGAERGASLARGFVNHLIEQRCERSQGKLWVTTPSGKAELQFKFVGLFDAQSEVAQFGSTYEILGTVLGMGSRLVSVLGTAVEVGTGATSGASLRGSLQLDLPAYVERVVHMVAGNETRGIAAVDTVAHGQAQSVSEWVCPGSQADVTAGLAPLERTKAVDLAMLPARKMLFEAKAAGVPVFTPDQLEKHLPQVARLFHAKSIVELSARSGSTISASRLASAWRSACGMRDGMPLEDALLAAQAAYIAYLRVQHAVRPTVMSNRAAFQAAHLHRRKGWDGKAEELLLKAWLQPKPALLERENLALYAHFVHPPVLHWGHQMTMQDRDVLTTRPISGDPDLIEEVRKAVRRTPEQLDARSEQLNTQHQELMKKQAAARQIDRERAGISGYR
jgi:hypothetical protein